MGRTIEEKIPIQLYTYTHTQKKKKERERERERDGGRERANEKRFCQFLSTVPFCIGKGLVPEPSQDEKICRHSSLIINPLYLHPQVQLTLNHNIGST